MLETNQRRGLRVLPLIVLAAGMALAAAPIKKSYWDDWDTEYPFSQSDDNVINGGFSDCLLCHDTATGGDGWNSYGWKMREFEQSGSSTPEAIVLVEPFDSDGDGTSNLFEINANTQPGWTAGNSNTIYYKNGSTLTNQPPPATILGNMDPACGTVVNYCTPGRSASGCKAKLSTVGAPSASAPSGFVVTATSVEGGKQGLFFFGVTGRQSNSWGNGTSFQCVIPPVKRGGLLSGTGTPGLCDGTMTQDLNTRWTAMPLQNPGAGAIGQAQLWYRDPMNTSNQTTSLSDAIEYLVCP